MSSTVLSENTENTCVVCFKNVSIYSIGECDHPVCYECSTRMRVLCRQNECPICRQDMPKVIFTKNVQPFKNIKNNTYLMDKKFKICFDNAEIQSAYSKLLEHVCTICPGRPAFRTFQNLKDHMRKEHELHYCDLCVDNLKIFTGERRCYTRQELAQHRRKGDPDDRSHRGHPLCEFCDQRYMDNDELFRHLRRDHLFCHFCDADGFHRYYSSYDYLRDHFRADHFLCEEGSCMDEKFTSAFRSEIDLKAHRASVHGRTMGKAAAKQARTLELEFTLAPRPRPERGGGGGGGGRPGQRGRPPRDDEHLLGAAGPAHDDFPGPGAAALAPASAAAPRTHCPDEFPTLSGAPAPPASAPLSRPNGVGGLTIRAVRQPPLAVTDENFPALGGADAVPPTTALNTVRLSVNSERAGDGLSIRVNRRTDPHATRLRADDFPSLGASTGPPGGSAPAPPPASSVASGQWLHVDRRGRPRTPLAGPPQGPPPKVKSLQEDFPSLGAPASAAEPRAKKASSVVIPVTPASSWLQSNGSVHPAAAAPTPAVAPATPASTPSTKQELMGVATIKVKSKKKKQQQQPPQQQQAKNTNDAGVKEAGKRKKREDASGSASTSSKSATRSGEEEITSKLEGVLTCKESSSGGGDGRGAGHSSSSSTGSGAASAAAAAAERKRSELLIASLRPERAAPPPSPPESPPLPAIPREDFPSLGCPPGFWRPVLAAAAAASASTSAATSAASTTAPPPGFGGGGSTTATVVTTAAAGPPPGFSSVTLNSVARAPAPPGGNGLTFTSSSGRSYPILPRSVSSAGVPPSTGAPAPTVPVEPFVPPRDAERRNQALVARVRRAVPLDDFLQLSVLYRQGALPAATFRSHCRHLLGEEAFADVFPELLALLPDVAKQQELLAAHEEEEGSGSLSVQVCASCGQVLASGDLRHHLATSHHLENHFTSTTLGKASPTTASAWDNRK